MRAYLDYNIFTSIEDEILSISDILQIDKKINEFPFSASHIQEADNIRGETEQQRNLFIQKRLETIKLITNSLYIYHDLAENKGYFQEETPESVLETIREVPFGKPAMQMFVNLFSPLQKEEFRLSLGIDLKRLNNYLPQEVIEQLDKSLVKRAPNMSFLGLIEMAMSNYENDKTYGLHNRFAGVFEILDLLGYWKDKATPTSNYARLWDSSHVYFASFCDYFISDDKRNRNKAKVVYDIYNIKTKVLSSKGL